MEACPGGGGPFARRLGASRRFFPPPAGSDSWNLVPAQGALPTRTEQVRRTVQTVPPHRQSSWGEGAGGPERGWLVRRTPQVCCSITGFNGTGKMLSFAQSSTRPPIPVKCYVHRSAVRLEPHPRGLNPGCAGKCRNSFHITLKTEAAKQPCVGRFSCSLRLQRHGRW